MKPYYFNRFSIVADTNLYSTLNNDIRRNVKEKLYFYVVWEDK